ncbi:MAG: hypothetical protein R2852_08835 [Bacteroidia bacterium]
MTNSSRNWNNENLNNEQLAEHLQVISQNKLEVNPDELEITLEQRKKKFFKHQGNNKFHKNKKYNNYKK